MYILNLGINEKKSEGTHMHTDCPTEEVRGRKIKRKRRKAEWDRGCQRWAEEKKLPHTRDPEFATPETQEKKRDKDREESREKTVKHKQRCDEVDDRLRCKAEVAVMCGARAQTPTGTHTCRGSPFHAAPAFVQSSLCTSGPPASVLQPRLHSARSEPFYHW